MPSVVLCTTDGGEDDLATLADLLSDYDELRGHVRAVRAAHRPGDMGAAIDALAIALVPGGAASVLAAGVALWLRRRHPGRPGSLALRLDLPDGTRLHLDANGVDDVQSVIAAAVKPWTDNS